MSHRRERWMESIKKFCRDGCRYRLLKTVCRLFVGVAPSRFGSRRKRIKFVFYLFIFHFGPAENLRTRSHFYCDAMLWWFVTWKQLATEGLSARFDPFDSPAVLYLSPALTYTYQTSSDSHVLKNESYLNRKFQHFETKKKNEKKLFLFVFRSVTARTNTFFALDKDFFFHSSISAPFFYCRWKFSNWMISCDYTIQSCTWLEWLCERSSDTITTFSKERGR